MDRDRHRTSREKKVSYVKTKIYLLLLFVMFVWGINVSALKIFVMNVDPLLITSVRIFIAGILVLGITYLLGIFRLPTKKEIVTIGYIACFNVILHHIFLAFGLLNTTGVNAGIIFGASPLVVLLLSVFMLKMSFSRLKVFGFLFGFIGIIVTTSAGAEGSLFVFSIGDIFIFISMLVQALSFIMISKLNPSFDPRLLTGYMLTFGSLIIFVVSLFVEGRFSKITKLFSSELGFIFLFSALICTAVGHMVYNYAIKRVGPAESAVFVNLETLFAVLGAAFFLDESIFLQHVIGFLFIFIGVFLGSGALELMIRKRKQNYRTNSQVKIEDNVKL